MGMKKKNKKPLTKLARNGLIKAPREPMSSEAQGVLLIGLALVLFLSLLSFAYSPATKNILGAVGHTIGKSLHALFGLSSYFLCPFIGWVGLRKILSKPLSNLFSKSCYVLVFMISLSMLLSLVELRYPNFGTSLYQTFYKSLWYQKLRYHLGGAPFYYLYNDLSGFNFRHIINDVGVGIIFSSTLVASIMCLAKIRPRAILDTFIIIYHKVLRLIPRRVPIPEGAFEEDFEEEKEERRIKIKTTPQEPPKPITPPIDQTRMVKLRAPSTANEPEGFGKQDPEMLAIKPETNLKARPSISRKSRQDMMPSFPFDLLSDAAPEAKPPIMRTKDPIQEKIESKMAEKRPVPATKRELALDAQRIYNGDFSNYKIPSIQLLREPKKVDHTALKKDLRRQAEVLEETLLSFGIEAKVGQINCGPTINSFEVHPAIGVKVQKIKTLENDIALNMEAKSIRIIAPIPGKAAVGIEIPNTQPQEVAFKDMMSSYQQSGRKFYIPLLLGKAVNGDYVMSDLTKMPHCIIAGATGSGKSVCINTIVMSIVLNAKPDEIKLIMVDPKKVELTPYSKLPHMLAPVITEPQGACEALRWLVKEMEQRYNTLKLTGVRNITSFNTRPINKEAESALGVDIPEKMFYIVCIIDELADLMMVSSNDIETYIARIAQMARAVGIHLILATQRPSREVITGLIKANFPTRIAFKVASRVNSQIILDDTGAESLLGNGDMLFLPPGSSHLTRAQGAYVHDEDIYAIIAKICEQAPPNYLIQSFDDMTPLDGAMGDDAHDDNRDPLYMEALNVIVSTGNASTTFLQRKLKIGYARAASLIDELEQKGVVGPADGSKPRKILVARSADTMQESEALG